MLLSLYPFFYYMTKKRFYSELTNENFLSVYDIEKHLKLITIFIEEEEDDEKVMSVDLTIEDVTELIDVLNKEILKLKGGTNA